MNWDTVEGSWRQVAGKVKQQWGKLTSDAIMEIQGQRDELVGKIQATYGITRSDAERHVQDLDLEDVEE
jgi:uncharacterized protein YjbJ (UPF0337 family)